MSSSLGDADAEIGALSLRFLGPSNRTCGESCIGITPKERGLKALSRCASGRASDERVRSVFCGGNGETGRRRRLMVSKELRTGSHNQWHASQSLPTTCRFESCCHHKTHANAPASAHRQVDRPSLHLRCEPTRPFSEGPEQVSGASREDNPCFERIAASWVRWGCFVWCVRGWRRGSTRRVPAETGQSIAWFSGHVALDTRVRFPTCTTQSIPGEQCLASVGYGEYTLSVIQYDPETGLITCTDGHLRVKCGYLVHIHKRKQVAAHRLAYQLMTGNMPADVIDHINGNRLDNRRSNLRAVSRAENNQNQRGPHRSRRVGTLAGAHWHARDKSWFASISIGGKTKHLGSFKTDVDAHAAYIEAKRELHKGCTV